jgi:hypothetical protein
MAQFRHNNNDNFGYEKTTRVWGGFKDRAKKALLQVKIAHQTEEFFLDYLLSEYPEIYNSIEWAIFYNYPYKFQGLPRMQMHQVIINIKPSPKVRDLLFKVREDITFATSWYPSVTGSRAWINSQKWNSGKKLTSIGTLMEIIPIENSKRIGVFPNRNLNGTSFKIRGSNGNILFDCGYNCETTIQNDFNFIFLSHYHKDHSGGIKSAIEKNPFVPFVSSLTSLTFLETHPFVPNHIKYILNKNALLPDKIKSIQFNDNSSYEFFPVYHSPGSFGIKVIDNNQTQLTFLGDICLRNGFYDSRKEIFEKICHQKGRKNYVFLDCAMIGNKEVIEIEDNPNQIFKKISEDAIRRNIIVVSSQVENTIYSYLLTFSISSKIDNLKKIKIIVSEPLYYLIRTLLEPLIFNKQGYKDPIAEMIIGDSGMNFIETHRLYPLNETVLNEIPENESCIYFINESDLKREYLLKRIRRADDFILTGKMAYREDIPEAIQKLKPRLTLRVNSEDWSFHSNEKDIVEFIKELCNEGIRTLLFHKTFENLMRFRENNNFDKKLVKVIGDRPYQI